MTLSRFDYFLTYARNDQAEARALVEHLEAFGISIGCDFRDGGLRPGEPWIAQLEELMQRASSYLILIGERGIDRWVQAELDVALNRNATEPGFRIFPLLLPGIAPTQLSQFLGRFEAIRLAEDWRLPGSLTLAHLIATLRPPSQDTRAVCPFPGLRAFDGSMAAFFFGRSSEIRQLVGLLGQTSNGHRRWLQIEGASGSGKSSLARAGLLPAIERGWLSGTPRFFRQVIFRPGRQPLRSLAHAIFRTIEGEQPGLELRTIEETLARDARGLLYLVREHTPPEHGFVLLLDQLEEVFSLAGGDLEPAQQLDALLATALEDTDSPFYLVTTIRSDFSGELAKLPRLVRYLNTEAGRYLLPEINASSLAEAIRQPALLAGLEWESESLPKRIVDDAGLSPGSLPLVAHVLREMWERDHRGGVLTNDTYDRLGGVGGALARSADGLLESLSERERALAKKMLLSLIQVQHDTQPSQRVLGREELLGSVEGGGAAGDVLARLSGARDPQASEAGPPPPRLLSVRADQNVELVHETLLRNWQTLRRWMDENREALETRNDVEDAARAWNSAGRPEDGLPRGKQLTYFRKAEGMGSLARQFLAAAEEIEERARRQRRQRHQGLRMLAATVAALLLVGIIVLAVNFNFLYVGLVDELHLGDMESASTPESMLEHADRGEKSLRRMLGAEPSRDPHRLALARIEMARGGAHLILDRLAAASQHFEKAIDLLEVVVPAEEDRTGYMIEALSGAGRIKIRQNDFSTATALADRIASLIEETDGAEKRAILLSPLISYRIDLAWALAQQGFPEQAFAQMEPARREVEQLVRLPFGKEPAIGLSSKLVYTHTEIGQNANRVGKPAIAFSAFEEGLELHDRLKPHLSPREFARQQAWILTLLGQLAQQQGQLEKARKAIQQIPVLFTGADFLSDPSDRLTVVNSFIALAELSFQEKRWEQARGALAEAEKVIDRFTSLPAARLAPGEEQQARSAIELRLGNLTRAAGDPESARKHFERNCELVETLSKLQPGSPQGQYQHLVCLDHLARFAAEQKWRDKLAIYVRKAAEVYRGFPDKEGIAQDPQLAFLLPRMQAAR